MVRKAYLTAQAEERHRQARGLRRLILICWAVWFALNPVYAFSLPQSNYVNRTAKVMHSISVENCPEVVLNRQLHEPYRVKGNLIPGNASLSFGFPVPSPSPLGLSGNEFLHNLVFTQKYCPRVVVDVGNQESNLGLIFPTTGDSCSYNKKSIILESGENSTRKDISLKCGENILRVEPQFNFHLLLDPCSPSLSKLTK